MRRWIGGISKERTYSIKRISFTRMHLKKKQNELHAGGHFHDVVTALRAILEKELSFLCQEVRG